MADTIKQEDGQQPEESQLVLSSPQETRETSSTCLPDLTPTSPVAEKGDKIAESGSSCLTHHLSPPVEEEKATEELSETIADHNEDTSATNAIQTLVPQSETETSSMPAEEKMDVEMNPLCLETDSTSLALSESQSAKSETQVTEEITTEWNQPQTEKTEAENTTFDKESVDEPMDISDNLKGEEKLNTSLPSSPTNTSPTRKPKSTIRNPRYSSIIRTRSTKVSEEDIKEPQNDTGKTESEESEGESEEIKPRPGRGRGRGSVKRAKSLEGTQKLGNRSPNVSPVEGRGRRGRSRGHLTRATAAGMKVVQFLQLPWRQKRRRRGGGRGTADDDEEELEPQVKKGRVDDEDDDIDDEEEEVNESVEEEEESNKIMSPPTISKVSRPSPRGRGRGRGRRGRGAKSDRSPSVSAKSELSSPSTEDDTSGISKTRKRKDSDTVVGCDDTNAEKVEDIPVKKRRGRPKKKLKDDHLNSASSEVATSPKVQVKEESSMNVMDVSLTPSQVFSEPVKHPDQIVQLLQLSENIDTGDLNDSIPAVVSDSKEHESLNEKSEEDLKLSKDTPLVSGEQSIPQVPTETNVVEPTVGMEEAQEEGVAKPTNDNGEGTSSRVDNTAKRSEPESNTKQESTKDNVPDLTTPTTSSQPPNSMPVEAAYPFPRYSIDEQGYPSSPHTFPPPPPHMHPFLAHAYPPFSTPPYHTFMLPTSPHFPHPYSTHQDCLPPGIYHHFPEDLHQFTRYPPPVTTAPQSNDNHTDSSQTESSNDKPAVTTPTNHTHQTTPIPTPVTHAMGLPHPLSQAYPMPPPPPHNHHPGYIPPYGPPPPGMMATPPLLGDWNMGHQMPPPTQSPHLPSPTVNAKEPRFPLNFLPPPEGSTSVGNPVDCPECGRHFKNNKALNGHMRLHGGFDWTRRVCRPYVGTMSGAKKDDVEETPSGEGERPTDPSHLPGVSQSTGTSSSNTIPTSEAVKEKDEMKKPKVKVETKRNKNGNQTKQKEKETTPPNEGRHNATLDDLCRAAEELERIERNELKPRPTPLVLPHERRINSFSPPYTPPPILSPARSLVMLSGGGASGGPIPAPSKIWPQRKGSENHGLGNLEEPFEPKINVGKEFQAEIPAIGSGVNAPLHGETVVWEPLDGLSQEDEDTIDGYLELACSPAVPHGGRNKELALHLLYQVNGSVKEAVRLLVMGKSLLNPNHPMVDYNFTGSKRWLGRERQQFRRAWRVHRKQFRMIESIIESKTLPEIIEYYYSWKKYCPDEYRGRIRHVSDDIMSEEDERNGRPPSANSNSSSSNDADQQPIDDSAHLINGTTSSAKPPLFSNKPIKEKSNIKNPKPPAIVMTDLPRNYPNIGPLPVQEYRCKYPGCNQVYTSIFALNGHIRIHGGSWYPKRPEVESMHNNAESSPTLGSFVSSTGSSSTSIKDEEQRKHQLEIAKTMVMDLPQPRSPLTTHTPSPKASPSHGKSSLVKSRKACSSSPADREGYYPCNRCGRVFHKVKSRSAHMKSHIIKQVH